MTENNIFIIVAILYIIGDMIYLIQLKRKIASFEEERAYYMRVINQLIMIIPKENSQNIQEMLGEEDE